MRPDIMCVLFLTSGVMSFNAGIWQIFRRGQKRQLLENFNNLQKPPLTSLPPAGALINQYEFRPVELEGTFDNEGSCLVGPRGVPSYKGAAHTDESRGGFLVMTPFQLAQSKQVVMVNRGWVPIDAGKHRLMLAQYISQGFTPATIRGILRKEEYLGGSLLFGPRKENEGPVAADLSWFVIRPWNMALAYYRRRWGGDTAATDAALVAEHGAHHYYIEMIEDFSGNDQRLVRGHAWPRRREHDEITYVHLTPIVHTMYIIFWFSITAGSLYGAAGCWRRQKALFAMRRYAQAQTTRMQELRQKEATAYAQAVREVEQRKHTAATATTTSELPHSTAGAGQG